MDNNKCRICLNLINNENAISIYNSWKDDVKIYIKIMDCTGIMILENDVNMPNSICLQCFDNLNNFYKFRNLCRESDIQLKSNIILVKNEPITETIEFYLESGHNVKDNINIDDEKNNERIEKTNKLINVPNLKCIFKLINGSKHMYLCKVCDSKLSVRRGRYNFKKHLASNKHRSKASGTRFLDSDNSGIEDGKTNVKKIEVEYEIEIDNENSEGNLEEETNKLINPPNLKSIFKLIDESKNLYLCNLCGSTISGHNGNYNLIRHLETIKHRSIISSTKSAENGKTGEVHGPTKLGDAEHGQSSTQHEDVFLTSLEKDFDDIPRDPIEIDKLTEASRILESKRRNSIFHLKLQEEFKADFEIDKNSKFNAFCKICKHSISIKSSGRADLVNHMNTYKHKGINFIRSRYHNKIEYEILQNGQTFICEICGNVYNKMFKLKKHILSHNETYSFSCKICHKKFRQSSHIRRHMRIHTGEKPFKCKFCGRLFAHYSTKLIHERTHTDERPFPCQTCGKRFRIAHTRNEHMKTHTGEKAFSCETCNIAFTKKCHLTTHYKSKTHQNLVLA